jgi:hypothetical protein
MTSSVAASHKRIVQSDEDDAMYCPSGENARDGIKEVWPVNGPATTSPVMASEKKMAHYIIMYYDI